MPARLEVPRRPGVPRPNYFLYQLMGVVVDTAARGDFVYDMRANPQTEDFELVRYRIVEPF